MGLTPTQAQYTYTFFKNSSVEQFAQNLEKYQIQFVTVKDPHYPQLLLQTNDAPYVLFYRGVLNTTAQSLAVVGTRKPTHYGRQVTQSCVQYLASHGVSVISGLAYGVDAIAHKTTLEIGGYTIAVLGSSIDQITPTGNTALGQQILRNGGALLSEYGPGYVTRKQNFIARNRIVSGLSEAVLITEGAQGSGSLATAQFAIKQNRTVYAVPGNITSPMSQAPNMLIHQGATIVTQPSDIKLGGGSTTIQSSQLQLNFDSEEEARVYYAIEGEISIQELCLKTELSVVELNQMLTVFELQGLVSLSGGMVRRV